MSDERRGAGIMEAGKLTETFSIKLSSEDVASLDEIVAEEKRRARAGHGVTRRDMVRLAIRLFIEQRLRRVSRGTF